MRITHLRLRDTVTEKDFAAYEETENGVNVTMPANSVIELRLAK